MIEVLLVGNVASIWLVYYFVNKRIDNLKKRLDVVESYYLKRWITDIEEGTHG